MRSLGFMRSFGLMGASALVALAMSCGSEEGDDSPSSSGNSGAGAASATSSTAQSTNTSSTGMMSSGTGMLTCSGEPVTNITGDCDLLQQNCGAGTWCDVVNDGGMFKTACVADAGGLKGKGEACSGPSECKAGLTCVGAGKSWCTPFCCPSSDEPCDGGSCDVNVKFGTSGSFAQVCSYSMACELFKDTCPEGSDCHATDLAGGLAVCDAPSSNYVGEGEECEFRNDCGESQVCHKESGMQKGSCRHLCDTTMMTAEPGKGGCLAERTCTAYSNAPGFPNLGVCLPAM